jgi:hypothetical protein
MGGSGRSAPLVSLLSLVSPDAAHTVFVILLTGTRLGCEGGCMADTHAVFVAIRRPDGSTEKVRIGSAVRAEEGFVLQLGELFLGASAEAPRSFSAAPSAPATSSGGRGGEVFPNYGRSKGMPIRGASLQDLEFYVGGARRTLADPSKARFHDKERALLAAMEEEMARSKGGGSDMGGGSGMGGDEPPPPGDEDAPF